MTTTPTQLGPYTIDREIGRGGMGVVYLGHDTKLDRAVAIKTLPEHLAHDPERLSRFEREARTLAQLNHANVAGIYGVEESEGQRYLILEYVEGETLADRLDRGALPIDETLEICAQIASGVEAAHEAGVIHRDLKPANIKITPDGQAKVLDFGLARAEETTSSGTNVSQMPTFTTPHSPTDPGAILGTAPYMSPEQARGRKVDKRTDIWSFGVIIYECLTGASPFVGETASDSIGAILHKEVDLDRLPPKTPAAVHQALTRCLQRDRSLRYRDVGDVALDLRLSDGGAPPAPGGRRQWRPLAIAAAAIAGAIVAAASIWLGFVRSPTKSADVRRFEVDLTGDGKLSGGAGPQFAISHSGDRIAFAVNKDGAYTLMTRRLHEREAVVLATERVILDPFFSPDNRWIGYFTDTELMRVAVTGGSPVSMTSESGVTASPRGGAWGPDGSIVFVPSTVSPLMRLSTTGGDPAAITSLDAEGAERSHRWPSFVPGRRDLLLFTSQTHTQDFDSSSIEMLEIDSGARHVLVRGGTFGRVTTGGTLVFANRKTLWAVALSDDLLSIEGTPIPVESDLTMSTGNGGAQFAFSETGMLLYMQGGAGNDNTIPTWFDLDGGSEALPLDEDIYFDPAISPDGGRVALATAFPGSAIMIFEQRRGVMSSLYPSEYVQRYPVWSPDGDQIVFSGASADQFVPSLFVADASGQSPPKQLLAATVHEQYPSDWSPDGGSILYNDEERPGTRRDILRYDIETDQSEVLVATPGIDAFAKFSPNGQWIAFHSDFSGGIEVYAQRIGVSGARVQISVGGGEYPEWTPDGAAILYTEVDDSGGPVSVMSVAFDSASEAPSPGTPEDVLEIRPPVWAHDFDVDPSGERILAVEWNDVLGASSPANLSLVLDWTTHLRESLAE